jgi:Rne/Rng family ribonuclease
MSKELVISAPAHERRVAILEEGQLVEIYIEREKEFALVGSIYKGRVTRVLPGMQSAFVDIGLDGDAFLYVSDVFENLEEYEADHVETPGSAAPPHITVPAQIQSETTAAESAEPAQAEGPHDPEPQPEAERPSETQAEASMQGDVQLQDSAGNREPQPQQNFQPRQEGDRNRGGGFRGGRGRWGQGGRGRGGRGPDRGRNLPPSKYASPQGHDQRGYDSRGPEQRRPDAPRYSPPAESGEEPIVLPGESLAKYRGRTPATMLPPDEPTALPKEPRPEPIEAVAPASETPAGPQHSVRGLPSWVLADGTTAAAGETPTGEEHAEASPAVESASAAPVEEPHAPREAPREESDLTDQHMASLASQLAEAKHEETHEEADADSVAGGAEFEEENGNGTAEAEEEAAEVAEALGEPIGEPIGDPEHDERAGEEEEEIAETETHEEAIREPEEMPAAEAAAGAEKPVESAVELLPGETRSPHGAHVEEPRYEDRPRDSARISRDPRSRFQRPQRGGQDRGRFGRRGGGGRPPQRFERRPAQGPSQSQGQGTPSYRAPQRRPQLISEMLKAGQDVIVQIAKEPLGKKGARITSHVALPGRFLVYMPTIDHIGVSRKIASAENRSRVRRVVNEARGTFPGGFIVRTAAGEASDDEIRTDIEFLGRTWNEIKHRGEERKSPALLHRDLNLVERILRDYVNDDFTAIWTDGEEEYGKIVEFMNRFQPKLVSRVKLYTKETPIFEEFGIQHDLDKALRPKVWLKSGGYIVINHTEALVAIDVNTGKYVGKGSTRLEDTIVKTNVEAVKEIVRQIRLRDLGGIIVVDFIDMEERRNREKVMGALQMALEQDKAPSKALGFNEFGLVAITRKRTKQALERVLCQPCPSCSGSGMVKSIPTLCYEIQAEARKMAIDHDAPNLTVRVHPEIAKALKTRESMLVDELEQTAHKHIIIQSDATLHWEQYDIY